MSAHGKTGPAFPCSLGSLEGHQDGHNTWQFPGLNKRELFAAMAQQALLSDSNTMANIGRDARENGISGTAYLASASVEYADALLAELAKEPQP